MRVPSTKARFCRSRFSRSSMSVATDWVIVPLFYNPFVADATKIESGSSIGRLFPNVRVEPSRLRLRLLVDDADVFDQDLSANRKRISERSLYKPSCLDDSNFKSRLSCNALLNAASVCLGSFSDGRKLCMPPGIS